MCQDPHPDRSLRSFRSFALRQVAGDPGAERHLRRVEDRAAEGSRSRRGVRHRAPGGRPPDSNGWGVWGTPWEIRKLLATLGFQWVFHGFLDHPLKETFSVQPSQKGPRPRPFILQLGARLGRFLEDLHAAQCCGTFGHLSSS